VGIKTRQGQAKVMGTILCVGGALLLSFYHGHIIGIGESSIHWTYAENMEKKSPTSSSHGNVILGPFFLILSALSWSLWYIFQVSTQLHFTKVYYYYYFYFFGLLDHSPSYTSNLRHMVWTNCLVSCILICVTLAHCMHGSSASFRFHDSLWY
jgi:hypothetical protein